MELSSQIHSGGAFVKIITWKLKKHPELRNSEFLMKLKFPSYVTPKF